MLGAVAAEIDRTLAATRVPGSSNAITAAELREWVVEYLVEYDEEVARFPTLVGQTHWNLWMMDSELHDSLFAAFVFVPTGVRIVCGTGSSFDIRGWDSDDPSDLSAFDAQLRRDFRVPEPAIIIGRADAVAWLGRGW